MRLSEYRLPDKTTFAVFETDTRNLPGVRHDVRDDEGNVWVSVDRLARHGPPAAPEEIKDWIAVSDDPLHSPEIISERLVTVTKFERDKAVSAGTVLVEDILEVSRKADGPADAPPMFDLRLRLADRPEVQSK